MWFYAHKNERKPKAFSANKNLSNRPNFCVPEYVQYNLNNRKYMQTRHSLALYADESAPKILWWWQPQQQTWATKAHTYTQEKKHLKH